MARAAFGSIIVCSVMAGVLSSLAPAQDNSMSGMNMQMPMAMEDHDAVQLPSPHAGSGTAWQPASVPGHAG